MLYKALLGSLTATTLLFGAEATPVSRQTSVDSFISSENAIAIQGVLNNIGSGGSKASGAAAGIVVASPSKSNPDCTYMEFSLLGTQ